MDGWFKETGEREREFILAKRIMIMEEMRVWSILVNVLLLTRLIASFKASNFMKIFRCSLNS